MIDDPDFLGRAYWPHRRPREDLRILVAGCGPNSAARYAYRHRKSTVVGVDISEASLAHARCLKEKHGLTHGYANLVAHNALQSDASFSEGDALVESQYAGPKAALRPFYDSVIAEVKGFGGDVEVAPKKGYVSLRRKKQFAIVQPSTATRLDVGINLKGVAPAGRLEASGSFNAMVSHRVRVSSAKEIDRELVGWLKRAYDEA